MGHDSMEEAPAKVQVKVSRVEEIEVNPLVKNPTVDRACPGKANPLSIHHALETYSLL